MKKKKTKFQKNINAWKKFLKKFQLKNEFKDGRTVPPFMFYTAVSKETSSNFLFK